MKDSPTLRAWSEDGKKEWTLKPQFRDGQRGRIIVLYGPHVAYYVEGLLEVLETEGERSGYKFCIDAMGRNFGAGEGNSVYVDGKDLLQILREYRRGEEGATMDREHQAE